ncbi:winged helix-turn-helix domain-containing protein [Ketogulonicigenium vulgare]|uniref:Molybdenum-binding transcriptional regulator, ModE family protein n=1 Tax=Ketogulonicigenium vulgare (strain WSH-001) TaxID=759362 RepID=F9Y4B8_KETVW|nr:winged helix-turn-helix domain-containing protein [Ketogulonicigenium vulgare]ADO43447.1 molybdenum-binding transcriptional regulator [Ketogulonicigenium vulgare Y25]AEM41731.1 Molybdenum-binding transcriptional regulator, ModE family protein [Ketogulonicigenium vulgare WSH-001]ALJ81838.1 LysR family transcriptional regulator [Ketogulonicigenium vulgare]ANW34494.1 LysR family transcriptional regulator [Ketogulonicigenium vulgare]AOZ55484.1 molybdenum-binding transcriptional regulator [Ketog
MTQDDPITAIKLRLQFADDAVFGPGKAALLEHIHAEGSIAAAGRLMGMSYKRAWSLVEEMNRSFTTPLVLSARGGASGGTAQVTPTGAEVLAAYRALEKVLHSKGAAPLSKIRAHLRTGGDA